MTKRKPRRKAAASSRKGGGPQVGWMWWTVGVLAVGWIAFDANRATIERHVPQLARLARSVGEDEAPRRAAAPAREPARAAPPVRETAAVRQVSRAEPVPPATPKAAIPKTTVPVERPVRSAAIAPPIALPAAPQPRPASAAPPAVVRDESVRVAGAPAMATRQPMPLRRQPSAGSPVWMVLDPGRPLRVTKRQGDWALVQSGIFTGWVDASAVIDPRPVGSVMPSLAAARPSRAGPVPEASVPGGR